MNNAEYLGDGVYAIRDDWNRVALTTGDHNPAKADNVIVLEPEVLAAFDKWLRKQEANT